MLRLMLWYFFLFGMAVAGCTDPANQKSVEPRIVTHEPAPENRVPGQYIVTLKEGVSSETLKEVFNKYGIKSIQDLSRSRYLITLDQDPGAEKILNQAAASSEIESAQPNYIYREMQPSQKNPQLVR